MRMELVWWQSFTRRLLVLAAVLLVCCRALAADEGYPEFTWDRVPLYAHLAVGDGLKAEQIEFLADQFSVITFTGGTVTNGSVELNIAASAKAIKQRNPKVKVIFYWASDMPKPQ